MRYRMKNTHKNKTCAVCKVFSFNAYMGFFNTKETYTFTSWLYRSSRNLDISDWGI